ncbi:50S ribosomal protein L4 [Raineyella sp.]|uniref:50S ribosomal protein L4 n=1 Tax=bioreactor metagenome TaxID=1076179 RepID=A0A644YZ22_9ZZZZ|nr:50S ribosomal protein L4 [Raineyella sp.]MEA5154153.1 50S ribosomal protein L4 [Raineyella sp.]
MSTLTIDVLDAQGKKAGTADLPAEIFDVEPNIALIHQVVTAQLAAARQGTHKVKTRGEVSGGGKKPWRQKGTGRARQGSIRSPQWTGGGVAHGPQPRSYAQRTPKKMIAAALYGSLTDRFRDGNLRVVTGFGLAEKPSTRTAVASLGKVSEARKVLVVVNRDEEMAQLSLRNATSVHLLVPDQLNAYDVLNADDVVFTKAALDTFVGVRNAVEVVGSVDEEQK